MRYFIAFLMSMIVACAAPPEPASLRNEGEQNRSDNQQKSQANGDQKAAVDYGGALVGDDATRSKVKECLDKGNFYERRSNPVPHCTQYALAKVVCKEASIKDIMSDSQKADYEKFLKTTLAGYSLDQCLNCESPAGNSYCEGSDPKRTDAGIRLYFVKEKNVGSQAIGIMTIYISP